MRKAMTGVCISILAGGAFVLAQGSDAAGVLASVRDALGGDARLSAVKTIAATGRFTRFAGNSGSGDYELVMEVPDKFVQTQPAISTPEFTITRSQGFNGEGVVSVTELPPQLEGLQVNLRNPLTSGSPEQQASARRTALLLARQSFAQMTLGMFAASFPSYPLEFGAVSSVDLPGGGAADVIDVKGAGDFVAKFVVDRKTHLPIMITWQAKEPAQPIVSTQDSGGGQIVQRFVQSGTADVPPDLADQLKQMEANRKVVEYRLTYSDYRQVNGLTLPFKYRRSIAGQPGDEITLSSLRTNVKIDPQKFAVVK